MAEGKSLGQVTYEALAEAIKWTSYVNDPRDPSRVIIVELQPWTAIPIDRQQAWNTAAQAVLDAAAEDTDAS